jgi:hypothetical protein
MEVASLHYLYRGAREPMYPPMPLDITQLGGLYTQLYTPTDGRQYER